MTTVKIISESNDWIEITHNGESGWISSQYIQENNSEEISQHRVTMKQSQAVSLLFYIMVPI